MVLIKTYAACSVMQHTVIQTKFSYFTLILLSCHYKVYEAFNTYCLALP